MKLYICGEARHGKDTVAEIISDSYGLSFRDSSKMAMDIFLRESLLDYGLRYRSDEECYQDRVNHRKLWFDLITAFNGSDPSRLSREIFERADIYVGIRNRFEFLESKSMADLSIWVDASERIGRVPGEDGYRSGLVLPSDCDIVIQNNGSRAELEDKVHRLCDLIMGTTVLAELQRH